MPRMMTWLSKSKSFDHYSQNHLIITLKIIWSLQSKSFDHYSQNQSHVIVDSGCHRISCRSMQASNGISINRLSVTAINQSIIPTAYSFACWTLIFFLLLIHKTGKVFREKANNRMTFSVALFSSWHVSHAHSKVSAIWNIGLSNWRKNIESHRIETN